MVTRRAAAGGRYSDAYMHYSGDRKRPTDALPMLKFFLGDPDNWRIGTSKVGAGRSARTRRLTLLWRAHAHGRAQDSS